MNNTSLAQHIYKFVASPQFFYMIVVLFVAQALWLAFSGIYPMAFDEDFHLGIIKIYAESSTPFLGTHPAGADVFGAITRDPSYLYHYLMSFPYRIVSQITENTTTQIITLRLMNIAFFTSALFIWRSVLLKTKASPAIIHLCILIFTLLPIVPFLAAHINYDNVFVPAVALVFLYSARIATSMRNSRSISSQDLSLLLIICLATSLIKYAFLPILIAVVVFFGILIYIERKNFKLISKSLTKSWRNISVITKAVLIVLLLVSSILFAERYAINMVRYHEPVPDCSKVLSVEQCRKYGPWGRDYNIAARKPQNSPVSPIAFTYDWVTGMWLRTFFAVAGQNSAFQTRGPLLVPASLTIFIAVFSLIAAAVYAKSIWSKYQKPVIALFLAVILIYLGLLWIDRYMSFIKLGQTVALNGRYLIPLALPIMLLGALGLNEALGQHNKIKLGVASLIVIGFLLGGGAMTFILRSNDAWLWRNDFIIDSNQQIRETIGPIIPGYDNSGLFMSQN